MNCYRFGGFKEYIFSLLQFWREEVRNSVTGLKTCCQQFYAPSGGYGGNLFLGLSSSQIHIPCISCLCPLPSSCLSGPISIFCVKFPCLPLTQTCEFALRFYHIIQNHGPSQDPYLNPICKFPFAIEGNICKLKRLGSGYLWEPVFSLPWEVFPGN